jgi:hypothetical protein
MLDTRFTAIDSSHWTITHETIKLGEVSRDHYGTFMLSPAPGRVFRSDELDSISVFMHTEHDRDVVTLLPNRGAFFERTPPPVWSNSKTQKGNNCLGGSQRAEIHWNLSKARS